jgi:cytochrome b561
MLWKNNSQRFGAISQIIHWLSVLLVGLAWITGLIGDDLPRGDVRELGETVHVSAGEFIGGLLLIRLVWLIISRSPKDIPLPIGRLGTYAGKLAHMTLYGLLFGVVATGIILQFARGDSLSILGFYEIASPWMKDKPFAHSIKGIHELLAHSLIILATIHACAALIHHYVFRDETLRRILPISNKE